MDLYKTIANWTGWPVIVAVILLASAYAYSILNHRVELLKDKNEWLENQLNELRQYSPDILAKRLADRMHILNEELERLTSDHETSQLLIKNKEVELGQVKTQILNFKNQIEEAQELLTMISEFELVCPKCGAPLTTREYHTELVEYEGRDLDVDHEIVIYECGFMTVDQNVESECPRVTTHL